MGHDTRESTPSYDVAVIGGGPAGCSAALFTARSGLDTVVFDRGRSSIQHCAYLENYLGFPAGIDIETMYGLMHDHAETAGCDIVSDLVESVDRFEVDDSDSFTVHVQEGPPVTARRVIAATRYDGEYLRGLDDDAALFETYEHDGEEHESFDGGYADHDGVTPVRGLYVASPSDEADMQAIVAAGRGACVARRVVADAKLDDGWWEAAATGKDWVRREAELGEEWTDRETWIDWFDDHHAERAPVAPDSERFQRVREAAIDESRASYVTPEEIEKRPRQGHRALAEQLDVEALVAGVDERALLDAMDDDVIRAYVDADQLPSEATD